MERQTQTPEDRQHRIMSEHSVDTHSPHIMITLSPSEYELLFGEKPDTSEFIGAWLTARDLQRGIVRWKKMDKPNPIEHEDRLSVIESLMTECETLTEEKSTLSVEKIQAETERDNSQRAFEKCQRSYNLQKTQVNAKTNKITELASDLKSANEQIEGYENWVNGWTRFQRFILRLFRIISPSDEKKRP